LLTLLSRKVMSEAQGPAAWNSAYSKYSKGKSIWEERFTNVRMGTAAHLVLTGKQTKAKKQGKSKPGQVRSALRRYAAPAGD
jgi:hypothetical protein